MEFCWNTYIDTYLVYVYICILVRRYGICLRVRSNRMQTDGRIHWYTYADYIYYIYDLISIPIIDKL